MTRIAQLQTWWDDVVRQGKDNPIFWRGVWLAVGLFILDQLTKAWILYSFDLPAKRQVPVLPFFNLTYVENTGVSFGMLAGANARVFLAIFSSVVALALLAWLAQIRRPVLGLGVASVFSGAVGNLVDRIAYGHVVDFLDFSGLYFPWVFNVADSAISVGVGIILLDQFILEPRATQAAAQSDCSDAPVQPITTHSEEHVGIVEASGDEKGNASQQNSGSDGRPGDERRGDGVRGGRPGPGSDQGLS